MQRNVLNWLVSAATCYLIDLRDLYEEAVSNVDETLGEQFLSDVEPAPEDLMVCVEGGIQCLLWCY